MESHGHNAAKCSIWQAMGPLPQMALIMEGTDWCPKGGALSFTAFSMHYPSPLRAKRLHLEVELDTLPFLNPWQAYWFGKVQKESISAESAGRQQRPSGKLLYPEPWV